MIASFLVLAYRRAYFEFLYATAARDLQQCRGHAEFFVRHTSQLVLVWDQMPYCVYFNDDTHAGDDCAG